jgi:hypothetical protein
VTNEALREPPQQRIRPGHIAGGASHIETQTNRQFGDLLHTLGEDSEDLLALVHGEPDDQHPPLSAREKLSEHDAGVSAVADRIRPARHQLEHGRSRQRRPFGCDRIEHQCSMLCGEPGR